jgi:DNA helicase-2/ATP-dependent DNA helicase PcrA
LAGNACGIMMVGDTRQAIYGFNGSSAAIMTQRFPEDYDVDRYVLDENFRSSEAVMRYAQAIEHTSQMVQKLAIRGEAACCEFADETEEARWVVSKILDLNTHGSKLAGLEDIPFDSIAVLARNRYVLEELRKALAEGGVAFNERVASGGAASSESDLFNYFHAGLRLMVNPNDQLHLQQLNIEFAPDKPYKSFEEICSANSSYDGLTIEASNALRESWNRLSKDRALRFDLALEVLKEICEDDSAFSGDDERVLATHDCEQWTTWWERYRLATGPSLRSLSGFLRALSLGEVLDGQSGEGVTLSTIHLAKGLEFDVVFVIGLNNGTFPDYRSCTPEQIDEERHSMFVAITRSKRLCYVTRPVLRTMPWGGLRPQTPSPFFVELQRVDAR